jgi:HSP20 family molecular chaperone IbpA
VSALVPAADAYETGDEFVVELEVPGFDEKELSIAVSTRR